MPKVATAVIVLSTLGAVIDMALTVTTSVYEVKCHKPDIKMNKLVQKWNEDWKRCDRNNG